MRLEVQLRQDMCESVENASAVVIGRGRDFPDGQGAIRSEKENVGECAADVHSYPVRRFSGHQNSVFGFRARRGKILLEISRQMRTRAANRLLVGGNATPIR